MTERSHTRPWRHEYGEGVDPTFTPLPYDNLAALIAGSAREHGPRTAFTVCLENGIHASLTFAEVDTAAAAFAAWLRGEAGIQGGDRVALQMPNALGFPVCAFGVFKAGAVLVNVNPLYTAHEMNQQLKDAGARVLVIIDLFTDKLPKALADTPVERVVTVSITDCFPWLKGLLVQGVLKYLRRQIPRAPVAATPLRAALKRGAELGRHLPDTPDRGLKDIAILQYTGGTTGVPKGAALTHGNVMANLAQILAVAGPFLHREHDVILTALPLYHIFAFTFNLMTFHLTGCRNILCPSPRPPSNLRRAFEQFEVTKFSAVNALFQGLLREDWFRRNPPRSIDLSISGGTALHRHVGEQWRELIGSAICEGYGLSETAPVVAVNPPAGEVRTGTIGIPVPGTDVRLLDDNGDDVFPGEPGELAVQGPQVMWGYWNHPDETERAMGDGWLRTGDIAQIDDRGYLTIIDRKKDMIDVSGFNVYPNEVEDVLGAHPDIDEAAVVGVTDEHGREHVRAYIVTRKPELTEADVLAWARRDLTAYKVPKEVIFRDELPKSSVGKVLRKALRE